MENIIDKFKNCKAGDILEISWDRRNGELNSRFNYYGINPFDSCPLLIDIRNMDVKEKTDGVFSYSKIHRVNPVVFFDAPNKEIGIKEIKRIFCMPSYETDGVYGIEGINWARNEEGSIIVF